VEGRAIQERLREQVHLGPCTVPIHRVAGMDVSVKGGDAQAAVALLSFPDLEPLEAKTARQPAGFPYVPGLLAFREGPVVLAALEKLEAKPDVLLFDAHGLAHPRRMGLATHLGLLLDLPAIGCAKSRLCGEHGAVPPQRGGWVPLVDGEEIIGAVVRTRSNVRPVYVSIGHRVDLDSAVRVVLFCCARYRLPQPIRWAHQIAGGASLTSR